MAIPSPWYLTATPLRALPWLIRLRTTTAALELAVIAVALVWPAADFPLRVAVPLIAVSAAANLAVASSLARQWPMPAAAVVAGLWIDVALLTWLLDLTGGPFNPFAVVFAVHVALAGVTVGRAAAVAVAAAALAGYGLLLYLHSIEGVAGHHRLNDFPTHLFTMWVTVAPTAELASYFAVQASLALDTMRRRAMRSERVASLTTLAAGAAHELSTPLATIAVAARELERTAASSAGPRVADDARLIRTEVDRCRAILDQMSGRAAGTAEDVAGPFDVAAALLDAVRGLPGNGGARIVVDASAALPVVHGSRTGFRQAMASLLGNALDASPPGMPVEVTARPLAEPDGVRIAVRDRGPGMAPEVLARAGEPFFTTREAGRGLGLGLFLARVFAERSGGLLSIDSHAGTTVTLDLPSGAPGADAP